MYTEPTTRIVKTDKKNSLDDDILCLKILIHKSTAWTSLLRQRLHERGFICNRIVFDVDTSSVYTASIESVAETRVDLKLLPKVERFQNHVVSSVV